MNKLLLFSIILLMASCKPDIQSIYQIDGELWDYDWANNKNQLAILMEEPGKSLVYIINVEEGGIQQTFDMNRFGSVSNITWAPNDLGLLILVSDEDGYSSNTLLFPFFDQQNIDTLGHLGVYHQTHVLDANSNYLAVLSSGEGHPDIAIYGKENYEKEALISDVYPGGIGLMGWVGDTLYVESDMRLDFGLTREERSAYGAQNGIEVEEGYDFSETFGPLDEFYVYKIDMQSKKTIKADMDPFTWEPISFDQKYSVRPEKIDGETPQTHFHFTEK